MTDSRRQSGYTLLELVFASGVALLLILPAMAMFYRSLELVENIESRFLMSAQARQIMRALWDGGVSSAGPGTDGTNNVYGLRASESVLAGTLRQGYSLYLESNGLTMTGDVMSSVNIQCTGATTPLPDCADNTDIEEVTGWLIDSVALVGDARSVANRTVETGFTVGDAVGILRSESSTPNAQENFRTIVTLNLDGAGVAPLGGGGGDAFTDTGPSKKK